MGTKANLLAGFSNGPSSSRSISRDLARLSGFYFTMQIKNGCSDGSSGYSRAAIDQKRWEDKMFQDTSVIGRRGLLQAFAIGGVALSLPMQAFARMSGRGTDPYRGIFPIGSTPVNSRDKIDFEGLANQVNFLRRGKVPGIAWPQLASGWSALSEGERLEGAEALVSAARGGDTVVVIGVQSLDFAETARYVAHAVQIGADAIICIPPANITDEAGLLDYYQRVGRLSDLPFFVQAIRQMSVDLIVNMYETIPTMRYLKDESGEPLERIGELLRRTNNELHDFSGRGAKLLISEMERGFEGSMPYVTLADAYQSCWEAWHANDPARAFEIFGAIEGVAGMFAQSSVETFVARGIFKEGSGLRQMPPAAGGAAGVPGAPPAEKYFPARTADEISRVLESYLKPYLSA